MKKNIWIVTLFPEFFSPLLNCGVAGKALSGSRMENPDNSFAIHLVNPRDYVLNKYKSVDDTAYGGGAGMVMLPEILKRTLLEGIVAKGNYGENFKEKLHVIFPSPRGKVWSNSLAREFTKKNLSFNETEKDLVFICGRYEGIDERFIQHYVDEEISIGNYILTGGELAVMCILDSALRFVPGVLGNKMGANEESFENGLLEEPQYTKPQVFEGLNVPEVLLNGHHANIQKFNLEEKIRITKNYRPDLWELYLEKQGSNE